jgi:hypothetical protein
VHKSALPRKAGQRARSFLADLYRHRAAYSGPTGARSFETSTRAGARASWGITRRFGVYVFRAFDSGPLGELRGHAGRQNRRHVQERVMRRRTPIESWHLKVKDRPECGAKTRAGGSCLVRVEYGSSRCRFHGGLSTGPKTASGRARIAEAQRRRWQAYRENTHAKPRRNAGPVLTRRS